MFQSFICSGPFTPITFSKEITPQAEMQHGYRIMHFSPALQARKGPESTVGLSRAESGVTHRRTGVTVLNKLPCKCQHQGTSGCSGHTQMWAGGVWCPGMCSPLCPPLCPECCLCLLVPWEKLQPATAQSWLCSLSSLSLSSCLQGLSCGDQNKLKQTCLLVKPDFSLCRMLLMLWPHLLCRDPRHRVCSREILAYFWSILTCSSPEL